jgi:cysteine-rich repeat protein
MGFVAILATTRSAGAVWYTRALTLQQPDDALTLGRLFGTSVASVGSNVLVGAPGSALIPASAAYLFDGSSGALLKTFTNPNASADDLFGQSVSAVGGNVLVGAPGDNTGAPHAGAAYLFEASTGVLLRSFQKPIVTPEDDFGYSVVGFGSDVLVGAPRDDTGAFQTGAVYLFDGSTGALRRRFLDPNPATGNKFGHALTVAGSNVLVGAPGDDAAGPDAGAAYLFDGATGDLLHTFQSPTDSVGTGFGQSVSALGDAVLVGRAGAAHLFDGSTGDHLRTFLTPAPSNLFDFFGESVAAVGGNVLVGAPGLFSRAVYLFDPGTGAVLQTLQTLQALAYDLGRSVAAIDDNIIVGATYNGGAAYVFDLCGNGVLTAGEQCDDGNTLDGDCCSSHCQFEPTGNLCDDGNDCTVADECINGVCVGNSMTCSDGIVQVECGETCDDGNLVNGDGCDSHCHLETGAPTATVTPGSAPTPTQIAAPTPSPTPTAELAPFSKAARKCQSAIAAQSRAFVGVAHHQLQKCLDLILTGIADGKTARLDANCRNALDPEDSASLLSRARAKVLSQVATKCKGITSTDINSPCNGASTTIAEVANCILDQHAVSVSNMVAVEYRDTCGLLSVFNFSAPFAALCTGGP